MKHLRITPTSLATCLNLLTDPAKRQKCIERLVDFFIEGNLITEYDNIQPLRENTSDKTHHKLIYTKSLFRFIRTPQITREKWTAWNSCVCVVDGIKCPIKQAFTFTSVDFTPPIRFRNLIEQREV